MEIEWKLFDWKLKTEFAMNLRPNELTFIFDSISAEELKISEKFYQNWWKSFVEREENNFDLNKTILHFLISELILLKL